MSEFDEGTTDERMSYEIVAVSSAVQTPSARQMPYSAYAYTNVLWLSRRAQSAFTLLHILSIEWSICVHRSYTTIVLYEINVYANDGRENVNCRY